MDEQNLQHPNFYRGEFISWFAVLELAMNAYIADHFIDTQEKRIEITELLIDRVTFENKRTALKVILDKKADKAGFKKTKNNKYEHAWLIEEIRYLNVQRVYFAHFPMSNLVSTREKVVELIEMRDKINLKKFSELEYDNLMSRLNKAIEEITNLRKSLPVQASTPE